MQLNSDNTKKLCGVELSSLPPDDCSVTPRLSPMLELTIKNPTRLTDDTALLRVSTQITIDELKVQLQKHYPENPAPDAITLIYAGKVLKDGNASLSSFLPENAEAAALHIVVKARTEPSKAMPGTEIASNQAQSPLNSHSTVNSQPASAVIDSGVGSQAEQNASVQAQETATPSGSSSIPIGISSFSSDVPPASTAYDVPQASSQYGPAYAAAYQAALQAIMARSAPGAEANQAGPSSPLNPTISSFSSHASFAYVPTMVPIPQPVFPPPAFMAAAQPRGEDQQAPGGVPHQPLLMQLPVFAMPYGYHMPDNIDLRQRRPHVPPHDPQVPRQGQPQGEGPPDGGGRLNPNVVALLQAFQEHGAVLPPHLAEAVRQAGARNAARPVARRRRAQLHIRVNIRALLQLAVLLVVVYQHCPPQRFFMLCALGLLLYLSSTPRIRALLQRLTGWQAQQGQQGADLAAARQAVAAGDGPNPAVHQPNAEGGPAGAPGIDRAVGGHAGAVDNREPQRWGVLNEFRAFVAGFIASLLPALDRDPAGAREPGEMQNLF